MGPELREIQVILTKLEDAAPGAVGGLASILRIARSEVTAQPGWEAPGEDEWTWLVSSLTNLCLFWVFAMRRFKKAKRENRLGDEAFRHRTSPDLPCVYLGMVG